MIFYPDGYGTAKLSLDQMKLKHGVKMHPEFAKRFFAYMEYKGGAMGVGGGWRSISNVSDASAAGKSFHQDQRFASGRIAYAAVDLVHVVPGAKHRAPTWAETEDAPTYGLHTFIKVPNEPWHIQCIEMRGWQTWVDAGRPDPKIFTLPGTVVPPDPPVTPPTPSEGNMLYIAVPKYPGRTDASEWWCIFESGAVRRAVNSDVAYANMKGVPLVDQNSKEHDDFLRSIAMT